MAGRRTRNRMELREQFDAAERRKQEEDEVEDEEEDEEDDDEEGDEAESESDDEERPDDDDEEEEEAPKPKKKPAKAPAKPKSRSRSAKIVRMRVTWGVFNNSNQRVAVYDYPRRREADEHAARLTTEKKNTHFVQPVKEPIDEKKEKE